MELYDEIPYPPLTHSATHPDRLAVIGRLMGLQPARSDACRLLDLGTGNGANIIAMAELLPGSHFVGLDISKPQIEDGRRMVSRLGLSNVDLQAVDVLDLPDAYGNFDYVIAHGFYSWVPQPVRDKGLRLIKASLAPDGIAFVSFNALPGWHQLAALRDLMRYRTRDIEGPLQRAQAARDVIKLLAQAQTEDSPFAAFVQQYHSSFQGRGPVPESQLVSTLLHDELSDINQPFYISEFVTAARAAGLEFLAEADLEGTTAVGLAPEVVEQLSAIVRDPIEMEQYLDFLRNRTFRRVLVCHAEAPVSRTLRADRQALAGLQVGSFVSPEPQEPGAAGVSFITPDGVSYTTDQPLYQAVFRLLGSVHPDVLPFEELLARTGAALGRELSDREADAVAATLLRNFLHSRSLVEFQVAPAAVMTRVSERPRTTAFARLMAASGAEQVPNLRHEQVQLTELGRRLLALLDGEHSRQALAEAVSSDPAAVSDELSWLGRVAMLVA